MEKCFECEAYFTLGARVLGKPMLLKVTRVIQGLETCELPVRLDVHAAKLSQAFVFLPYWRCQY